MAYSAESVGFLRIASLCGVFPLSVSYGYCPIAPCFKHVCVWGGGSVAIGRYCQFVWVKCNCSVKYVILFSFLYMGISV